MTPLQEAFMNELQSKEKITINEYVALYNKYCDLSFEEMRKDGADSHKAKVMSEYYMINVLSKLVNSRMVEQISEQRESTPRII